MFGHICRLPDAVPAKKALYEGLRKVIWGELVIYDLIDSTSENDFIKTLYERIINLMNIWTKLEKAFMFNIIN